MYDIKEQAEVNEKIMEGAWEAAENCADTLSDAAVSGYKAVEGAVTGGYKKVEDAVTGGYKKIEDTVTGGYRKVEDAFVDRFLKTKARPLKKQRQGLRDSRRLRSFRLFDPP